MPRCTALTLSGTQCRLSSCDDSACLTLEPRCHIHSGGTVPAPAHAETCSVCLDNIPSNHRASVVLNVCGHAFHKPCLLSWFRRNNITCPNCRSDVTRIDFMRTFPRDISNYMSQVHYEIGRLKSACAKVNKDMLMDYGINEQALVQQMEHNERLLPPMLAFKTLNSMRHWMLVFMDTLR